jgi:5-methylthioadenosine/S-adenosylhomocysteine deaminase
VAAPAAAGAAARPVDVTEAAMAKRRTFQVVRGGRMLDVARRAAVAADILIERGTIRAVGAPGLAAPAGAEIIDATDRILIPGLVNAHTHAHGNLAKGMGDRWTLELLLNAAPWIGGRRTLADKYLTALIGAVEMLQKGCTACYDLFLEFPIPTADGIEAHGRAYQDAGMRAVIAPMMADRSLYQAIPGLMAALPDARRAEVERIAYRTGDENVAVCRKLLERWPFDRDQVRPALAPTIPMHCADDFMVKTAELAREHAIGYHTHLAESKVQAVSGLRKYGCSLTAHLDALGIIASNFVAAHAIWLDDDDIKRLADQGAAVAHNPGSNMRVGSGIAAVRRMRAAKLAVGIGTDGASSADNLNMFEAMRLASFASKVRGPDHRAWLTTGEVLAMATEGSARVLGFEGKLGRLAPGYFADIVFLERRHVNYTPLNDVVNQLVHVEDGTAVDKVMVGGRIVVERGRCTTVDLDRLSDHAADAAARLAAANADARRLADALEPAIGAFCLGLARAPHPVHRYGGPPGIDDQEA